MAAENMQPLRTPVAFAPPLRSAEQYSGTCTSASMLYAGSDESMQPACKSRLATYAPLEMAGLPRSQRYVAYGNTEVVTPGVALTMPVCDGITLGDMATPIAMGLAPRRSSRAIVWPHSRVLVALSKQNPEYKTPARVAWQGEPTVSVAGSHARNQWQVL
jgi:hypothetical protein